MCQSGRSMKLATHLCVVLMFRLREESHHFKAWGLGTEKQVPE